MCVTPYIVQTNYGVVPCPCGHCFECLQQWSKDWRFRLKYEWDSSVACFALTLTYNTEFVTVKWNQDAREYQTVLIKSDLQKFFKRVRKNNKDIKFRYFAVGEYGGKYNRCHFHVILFFKQIPFTSKNQLYNYLLKCWNNGFIYLEVTERRHINYVSTYYNKVDKSPHLVAPFKCMSKSLGLCYLTPKRVKYFFTTFKASLPNPYGKGFLKLPRYYRKKLDDMTPEIEPNNYGYKWSDIVKMFPHKIKPGIDTTINDFCKHFDYLRRDLIGDSVHNVRLGRTKLQLLNDESTPNKIFWNWFYKQPDLVDALAVDRRKLRDAMVIHKYTRLKENYG